MLYNTILMIICTWYMLRITSPYLHWLRMFSVTKCNESYTVQRNIIIIMSLTFELNSQAFCWQVYLSDVLISWCSAMGNICSILFMDSCIDTFVKFANKDTRYLYAVMWTLTATELQMEGPTGKCFLLKLWQKQHGSLGTDSKVHTANMGPTWVLSAPDGSHVGPMNLSIRETRWGKQLGCHCLLFHIS